MRYEMKNFVKTTKKTSQVRPFERSDEWKRDRKIARKNKQSLRRKVA